MKDRLTRFALAVASLSASGLALAQTDVPNTFQAGQPARAAEVNANFATLETAVNTNANDVTSNTDAITQTQSDVSANSASIAINQADIQANSDEIAIVAAAGPAMVKANGQVIGAFLQAIGQTEPGLLAASHLWILSDTGYMFSIATWTNVSVNPNIEAGNLHTFRVRFELPNCTGQAYVSASTPAQQAQFFSGYVFAPEHIDNPTPVFYSPVGSTVVGDVPIQSSSGPDGTCEVAVGTFVSAIEVLPNDPLITGVPNQRNLGAPITLGR